MKSIPHNTTYRHSRRPKAMLTCELCSNTDTLSGRVRNLPTAIKSCVGLIATNEPKTKTSCQVLHAKIEVTELIT